jgi:hydrogenase expression/formation protein HypE
MSILSCPSPLPANERILLAHGGGGRLTNQLIEDIFLPAFANSALHARHDGAEIPFSGHRLAMTTDTYVVQPLEEGLSIETLRQVVNSMRDAARVANVPIVTGDTKVVDKGKGDGIFINTTGIGVIEAPNTIGPEAVRAGDAVLISGDLGRHGIAILSVREGLEFEGPISSDTVCLWPAVQALLDAGIKIHCLRDLTRGGLSSALNEIATVIGLRITIDETLIPVPDIVRGACELLGLDPLYVANEGRFAIFVAETDADRALDILRSQDVSTGAIQIGRVHEHRSGIVTLRSRIGGNRVLDMMSGEQLPRIC